MKRMYILFFLPVIIFFLNLASLAGYAQMEPAGYIASDSEWATPYFIIESPVQGPTIFIIGGTHGDELAGWYGAWELIRFTPSTGRLIIIPEANIKSVRLDVREVGLEGNLNRSYPGKRDGVPMERLADAIFTMFIEEQADLVLDLHESLDFHLANSSRLGQTLIAYSDDISVWNSMMAIERINTEIPYGLEKFTLLHGPVVGSTVWAAGKYLEIPAVTVETSRKLDLSIRINYQIQIVKYILEEFGVFLH